MKQTAMVLTCQKPTQTNRLPMALLLEADGEVREGLPGSTLEHGMREEKAPGFLVWKRIRKMQRKTYG